MYTLYFQITECVRYKEVLTDIFIKLLMFVYVMYISIARILKYLKPSNLKVVGTVKYCLLIDWQL